MTRVRSVLCLVLPLVFAIAGASNASAQNQGQTSSRRVSKQTTQPTSARNTKSLVAENPAARKAVVSKQQTGSPRPETKSEIQSTPTLDLKNTTPKVPTSKPANQNRQQSVKPAGTVQMRRPNVRPNPMRRTELVKKPVRIAQLPPINPAQANNSSRRVLVAPKNPVRLTPYTAPPMLPGDRANRVASLQQPVTQQAPPNAIGQNSNVRPTGKSGLSISEVSGIKFANPKNFLKAGNFKFSDPDKFISEPPQKMARKKSKPKRNSVKAVLASTKKNVLRIQDKQDPQTSPSDKIESLESKSVLDELEGSDVADGKIAGNENPQSAELDSKLESNLNLASPTSVDDANYLTVSDVRAPISFNPFGQIVQDDESGLIKDTVPLFRPAVAGTTYSEISGLAFQPHFAGWTAHEYNHKPLYFEETNLERYGNQVKYQPWISGAHFFASALLIPYKMGQEPPGCCITTLGHRRPGECVPYQIHRRPFSKKGFLMQALTVTAMSL